MSYKTISVRLVLCVSLTLACSGAWATDVSLEQARTAVGNWVRLTPKPLGARIGQTVRDARTCRDADGNALFHVVRFKEGGFVVAAADDGILPVVAFSDDDDLVADERNPLWVMLNRDLPQRRAFARKMAAQRLAWGARVPTGEFAAKWQSLLLSTSDYTTLGLSSVGDLRVSPLLTTTWNQWTDNNYSSGLACYNYYTPPYVAGAPSNYVCGCVATAGAQLMRYHQYPTASLSSTRFKIWVDGSSKYMWTMGGTYDWSNMVANPAASSTLAQRQAIGKLTYDAGVASHMAYTASGSSAFGANFVDALKSTFGYANAMILMDNSGVESYLSTTVLANLDAKSPVLFGIRTEANQGHEVVGDGYGYSGGTLYVHINLGWGGVRDAWYNLPTIDAYYYTFTVLDSIAFNVFPTSTGEIISGRVLDSSGIPVSGVTVVATNQITLVGVSAVTTDSHGIYAFQVSSLSNYKITASLGSRQASVTATTTLSASTDYTYRSVDNSMSYSPGSGTVGNSWGNDLTLPDPLPAAPTGVSAGDGTSTANVAVSWTSASYAAGYNVYRYTSSASNSASVVGSVASTNFSDATATPGALYYYWVKATNSTGSSAFSAYDTGYRALSVPTNVAASESSTSAVEVTWGTVTGASYYRVYRAATSTGTKSALSDWQPALAYSDATSAVGATNYYWVAAAVDASGTRASAYSDYDTGVRLAPYTVTTEVPVPFAWLDAYGLVTGGDYEAAALTDSDGDGYAAWQEYVAGTVPTNANSIFLAFIALSNGMSVVTWAPDLGTQRLYTVAGKSSLTNAAWLAPTNAASRFFRISVSPR